MLVFFFRKRNAHKKLFSNRKSLSFFYHFHCEAIRGEKSWNNKAEPRKASKQNATLFLIAQASMNIKKEKHFYRYYHRRYRK